MSFISVPMSTHFPFIPIPTQDFNLNAQKIDIWEYSLANLHSTAESLLNKEELQRAKRFHFPRHQRRFTMGRACLRIILGRYLNQDPKDLMFSTNPYGKPYLTHEPHLQFNLSHSQDLALLAVGENHPMGVDIEFFSGRPFNGMSNMMFSPSEQQAFARVPATLRTLAFFRVWAQKEAFIKACGLGLSYPTQSFDVAVLSSDTKEVWDTKHALNWHIKAFMPKIACFAALCHDPRVQIIRYQKWETQHAFG